MTEVFTENRSEIDCAPGRGERSLVSDLYRSQSARTIPPMLTQAHVRALRDNPSATVRADIAAAVGAELAASALTAAEAEIAARILEALAHDVERRVRQALAENVKDCAFLPREIAVVL